MTIGKFVSRSRFQILLHFLLTSACGLACSVGVAGCTKGANSPSDGKHFFEGSLEWRGVEGRPPGTPWTMSCAMRSQDLLCDVAASGRVVQLGFRASGSTLCFRLRNTPMWIPLSLQTIGMFFALLPEDIRREAVHKTQGQYRFTGQRGSFLGRSCEAVEIRDDDGSVETIRYSREEFFEGDQRLIPVLHQMGFESGFISSIGSHGLGYHLYEVKASGEPKLTGEITRMDPHAVDPRTFAGVCGLP